MEINFLNKFAFWKKKHDRVNLGVHVTPDALTVYQVDPVTELHQIPVVDQDWHSAFEALAEKVPGAHLHIQLSMTYYQLLVVDKPPVADAEVHQALFWSIKDMLTKPLSELHFDYFESPQGNNKVTVVVAERELLSNIAVAAQDNGVVIEGISIPEMAVTHLCGNEKAHLVLCHEPHQELSLTVVKQGMLYMQRSVRGFSQLHSISAADLSFGVADNLSLELQRSMDYFESQLRQAPVASINLLMEGEGEALAQLLSANFNQQVSAVPVTRMADKLAELAHAEFDYLTKQGAVTDDN